tara:strand:- start:28265 stop:29119 length:855 start_codon:yes stop_codon:yes gene_type:complete
MKIKHFFDTTTATFTYVVSDDKTLSCAIIDPVLDYNMYSGKTSTTSAEKVIAYIEENKLKVDWILETHAHADHISGAQFLKAKLGGKVGIGGNIAEVLQYWVPVFNSATNTPLDGSQFDYLFNDGERFTIGAVEVSVIYTPGHTPACISYLIEGNIFVGDALLMPHIGTARTDFPGGSAETLYKSIQKIFSLPDETKVYTCHDYPVAGTNASSVATIKEHKLNNKMVRVGISRQAYVEARTQKDKTMPVPKLLLPSVQVNIRAGHLNPPEENKISYIKIPVNQL